MKLLCRSMQPEDWIPQYECASQTALVSWLCKHASARCTSMLLCYDSVTAITKSNIPSTTKKVSTCLACEETNRDHHLDLRSFFWCVACACDVCMQCLDVTESTSLLRPPAPPKSVARRSACAARVPAWSTVVWASHVLLDVCNASVALGTSCRLDLSECDFGQFRFSPPPQPSDVRLDLASVSGSRGPRAPPMLSCFTSSCLDFVIWTTDHRSAKPVNECLGAQGWVCLFKYTEDLAGGLTHPALEDSSTGKISQVVSHILL